MQIHSCLLMASAHLNLSVQAQIDIVYSGFKGEGVIVIYYKTDLTMTFAFTY